MALAVVKSTTVRMCLSMARDENWEACVAPTDGQVFLNKHTFAPATARSEEDDGSNHNRLVGRSVKCVDEDMIRHDVTCQEEHGINTRKHFEGSPIHVSK